MRNIEIKKNDENHFGVVPAANSLIDKDKRKKQEKKGSGIEQQWIMLVVHQDAFECFPVESVK